MNRTSILGVIALMVVVGCSSKTDPVASNSATAPSTTATAEAPASSETAATETKSTEAMTFVSLKVPNMVWANCAASVRGALTKIDTITDIKTDPGSLTASFKVSPEVDYESELAKHAETNTHLADYTIQ